MAKIQTDFKRDIIHDFARLILQKRTRGKAPKKAVIFFRSEHINGFERDQYFVPLELLRYRKDNGRIASDVASYEKNIAPLKEDEQETQHILEQFLEKKDPDKTKELIENIRHSEQREPAIITCDGFLINGNRRKLALTRLYEESGGDEKYSRMRVVILPGPNDEGGTPTLKEIEQIENRYQLQSEGKAEYYKFDRALSIRRKELNGYSLEEQLRDDPLYSNLPRKNFSKEVEKYREEYLKPLECIDLYLRHLGREGLYDTISTGISDREGRWQAFIDYYNSVEKKLSDKKKRYELGVEEDEIGDIRDIAFKIIRKREFPDLPKVHVIMRKLPALLKRSDSKKALYSLKDVSLGLPNELCWENGREIDEKKKDLKWNSENGAFLINQVKKAFHREEYESEKETPLLLLEASLKKLNHEDMIPTNVKVEEYSSALEYLRLILSKAEELYQTFDNLRMLKNKTTVKNAKNYK